MNRGRSMTATVEKGKLPGHYVVSLSGKYGRGVDLPPDLFGMFEMFIVTFSPQNSGGMTATYDFSSNHLRLYSLNPPSLKEFPEDADGFPVGTGLRVHLRMLQESAIAPRIKAPAADVATPTMNPFAYSWRSAISCATAC